MYRFEVLFTLFLVTQPTLGTVYTPGKLFSPRKYADVNQVARRDCVPAAPNVSASALIADACRQNNQVDPNTCSDEIAEFIQQSRTSTCNVYSGLYNSCKSSNNGSLIKCSDSLLGYQECSKYTLQAYAYCGCYYSLPTELSSCANEQLQNQTAGSSAVPMSSTNSILATTPVPPPIIPIGPETPPPWLLTSIQPARETNSTSWITIISTMYLPIESPIPSSSRSKKQHHKPATPSRTPIPIDGTRTIITTFSIPEPASTGPMTKTPTTSSHPNLILPIPPPPHSPPMLSTKTLTLTLLSTIAIPLPRKTQDLPSIYLSTYTYTSTILTTISYTPTATPSPYPSPTTTLTSATSPHLNLDPPPTTSTTISITETTTIYTNLINDPIVTIAPFTLVRNRTASAIGSAVPASGVVVSGTRINGTSPVGGDIAGPGPALAGPGGWCSGRGCRRKKRSNLMPATTGVVNSGGSGGAGPGPTLVGRTKGWCSGCKSPPGRKEEVEDSDIAVMMR